jgi:dTDP-glucose 4,6-dehydratase
MMLTGGTGFIGSAACRFLVGEIGSEVFNVDNLASLQPVENHPRYSFRRGYRRPRRDSRSLARISTRRRCCISPSNRMSTVRSTARANSSRPISRAPTRCPRRRWTIGAHCRPGAPAGFRLHHVSIGEVFGSLGARGKYTEDGRYRPNSLYAACQRWIDRQ